MDGPLKQYVGGLIGALALVTDDNDDEHDDNNTGEDGMTSRIDYNTKSDIEGSTMNRINIETRQRCSSHEVLSPMIDHRDFPELSKVDALEGDNVLSTPSIGNFLVPILKQANGVLSSVPQTTLHIVLQPVVNALKKLDAELLLDLEITDRGPRVMDGVFCRPIKDQIYPALSPNIECREGHSCVRYLHISEVPDQYSIGIFVFGPYARIPLHDHPDMCVLSRVLYGDLQRLSLDLAHDDEAATFMEEHYYQPPQHNNGGGDGGGGGNAWFRSSWFSRMNSFRSKIPAGAKPAFKNKVDHLQAPDVTVLYPFEGNLHEFVAGPNGAAVLDVLLPPYDNGRNRDCTFYNIHDVVANTSRSMPNKQLSTSAGSYKNNKEPCFIVPTGQPENFHCISGKYRDLGDVDNDDYDDDNTDGDDDEDM